MYTGLAGIYYHWNYLHYSALQSTVPTETKNLHNPHSDFSVPLLMISNREDQIF